MIYTDNYQLRKPVIGVDNADVGDLNFNSDRIDAIMHASQVSLAPAYDQSQTYAEGDVVMYELLMYKCISPTTGVWDASKWERTTASESGGGGSAELDILGEGNGAVVSFADGASAELAKCIAEIVPKQAGSGTPSPDNVRAISGSSEVNTYVVGKNKCSLTSVDTQILTNYEFTTPIPAGTYYVSWKRNQGTDGIGMRFFYEKWDISKSVVKGALEHIVTFTEPVVGANFTIASYTTDTIIFEIQIEEGTTPTAYEPYKGTKYTTPLGQTVYGGQLNVLTGELTVDRAIVTIDGTESGVTWTDIGNNMRSSIMNLVVLHSVPPSTGANAEAIANYLERVARNYSADVTGFYWYDANQVYIKIPKSVLPSADTTGCMTYLQNHNLQICYEIATPQTVQLTPQEVNSLLGQNNISADTGDIDIVYVKASAPIQPNPTGEPTATLSKLGIEGTVFEVPSGGGGSSSRINYSTTEQVIGTWIDGKTLYQKTFDLTALQLSDNNWNNNILGTIGIKIKYYEGLFSIGQSDPIIPYEYIRSSSQYFTSTLNDDASDINIRPNMNAGTLYAGIVTIQYTKITD